MMELSIVIPVLNEEETVPFLTERIKTSLQAYDYEIIWVDDGSSDKTARFIKEWSDHRTRLISLRRTYGQTAAIAAGIDAARATYVVTMDGDLQNNPEDIPKLLDKLKQENWDVITGVRKDRKDGFIRRIPSRIANRLIRSISGVTVRDYGCSLKILKTPIAKNLGLYGELHRFIPILAALQGATLGEMEVSHSARKYGRSKYGLGRTLNVVSDLFLLFFFQKYFRRPIHFFGPLGMVTLGSGLAISFYLLVVKLMGQDIGGRPLLTLGVVLVLAGIQFLTFGLIAELMMRIYYESQQKKIYEVKEIFVGKESS
ncbi:MAG: glycosyltransferase family 2 protein [Cytophagales bacterium]|nr:glycosyltransferase family 2 protein [Cytophagales bacterium]